MTELTLPTTSPAASLRSGGTGNVSNMSATPDAGATAGTLARQFADRPALGTIGPNWPSYTPTVTFSGGSGVTVTLLDAKYEQIGKSLKVRTTLQVSWANGGSSPSDVSITLPGGQSVRGLKGDVGTNASANSPIFVTGNNGTTLTARQGYGGVLVGASGHIIGISWSGEVQ